MKKTKPESTPHRHIVILGNGGAGKTALVNSLTGREYDPAQAVTHRTAKSSFDGINDVILVDFGGQEIYHGEIPEELSKLNPAAAIVVIPPREEDPYKSINYWHSLLLERGGCGLPKFLVFTKCDERNLRIDENIIRSEFSFENIYKTSVKLRTGIQELRSAIINVCTIPDDGDEQIFGEVAIVVRVLIESLCELVAQNGRALKAIEWRQLEHIIAVALEELGFSVQLTPSSKDGGKDVVANCVVKNQTKTFYVEIKHWKKGDRPGDKHVSEFVEVNARDNTDGGLFISSSGFTESVYGRLGELSKQRVRLGNEEKIVSLCQHYVKRRKGIWQCNTPLPVLLFENTLPDTGKT